MGSAYYISVTLAGYLAALFLHLTCDLVSDALPCHCFLSWLLPVEKVAVLCRFLDIGAVTKNHLLKYSLAHAFCCFLTSVEDVNPAVATRARLLLDTIKRPSLQVTCPEISEKKMAQNVIILIQGTQQHFSYFGYVNYKDFFVN